MKDKETKLIEKLIDDKAFLMKFSESRSLDEQLEFLKENGFNFSEEEFKEFLKSLEEAYVSSENMSEEELENVSGGKMEMRSKIAAAALVFSALGAGSMMGQASAAWSDYLPHNLVRSAYNAVYTWLWPSSEGDGQSNAASASTSDSSSQRSRSAPATSERSSQRRKLEQTSSGQRSNSAQRDQSKTGEESATSAHTRQRRSNSDPDTRTSVTQPQSQGELVKDNFVITEKNVESARKWILEEIEKLNTESEKANEEYSAFIQQNETTDEKAQELSQKAEKCNKKLEIAKKLHEDFERAVENCNVDEFYKSLLERKKELLQQRFKGNQTVINEQEEVVRFIKSFGVQKSTSSTQAINRAATQRQTDGHGQAVKATVVEQPQVGQASKPYSPYGNVQGQTGASSGPSVEVDEYGFPKIPDRPVANLSADEHSKTLSEKKQELVKVEDAIKLKLACSDLDNELTILKARKKFLKKEIADLESRISTANAQPQVGQASKPYSPYGNAQGQSATSGKGGNVDEYGFPDIPKGFITNSTSSGPSVEVYEYGFPKIPDRPVANLSEYGQNRTYSGQSTSSAQPINRAAVQRQTDVQGQAVKATVVAQPQVGQANQPYSPYGNVQGQASAPSGKGGKVDKHGFPDIPKGFITPDSTPSGPSVEVDVQGQVVKATVMAQPQLRQANQPYSPYGNAQWQTGTSSSVYQAPVVAKPSVASSAQQGAQSQNEYVTKFKKAQSDGSLSKFVQDTEEEFKSLTVLRGSKMSLEEKKGLEERLRLIGKVRMFRPYQVAKRELERSGPLAAASSTPSVSQALVKKKEQERKEKSKQRLKEPAGESRRSPPTGSVAAAAAPVTVSVDQSVARGAASAAAELLSLKSKILRLNGQKEEMEPTCKLLEIDRDLQAKTMREQIKAIDEEIQAARKEIEEIESNLQATGQLALVKSMEKQHSGIVNLSCTCYFNTALQVLTQASAKDTVTGKSFKEEILEVIARLKPEQRRSCPVLNALSNFFTAYGNESVYGANLVSYGTIQRIYNVLKSKGIVDQSVGVQLDTTETLRKIIEECINECRGKPELAGLKGAIERLFAVVDNQDFVYRNSEDRLIRGSGQINFVEYFHGGLVEGASKNIVIPFNRSSSSGSGRYEYKNVEFREGSLRKAQGYVGTVINEQEFLNKYGQGKAKNWGELIDLCNGTSLGKDTKDAMLKEILEKVFNYLGNPPEIEFDDATYVKQRGQVKKKVPVQGRNIKVKNPIEIRDSITVKGKTYRLKAISIHKGATGDSGHYYAYVRSSINPDVWLCYNDTSISPRFGPIIKDPKVKCHQTGEEITNTRSLIEDLYVQQNATNLVYELVE